MSLGRPRAPRWPLHPISASRILAAALPALAVPATLSAQPLRTLAAALHASACAASPMSHPLIEGLDHVPLAVANLDQAAADFARLGFVIKPGRSHSDGIQNRHIKFPNGGGIELITATSGNDALSAEYVDWLKTGEGPAFWSLYTPDPKALTSSLDALQLMPHNEGDLITYSRTESHRLFFGNRLRSPTDGSTYWAHPNTAYRLRAIWLSTTGDERSLLGELSGGLTEEVGCAPFDPHAKGVTLPGDGDEVFVTSRVRRSPQRSIVGVTLQVRDIGTARQVLARADIPYVPPPGSCPSDKSLWIQPSHAHNMWLELRQ